MDMQKISRLALKYRPAIVVAVVIIALVLVFSIVFRACSNDTRVAASVNGTDIMEADITAAVGKMRTQLGLEDNDKWRSWLASSGQTAESIRDDLIEERVEQTLIHQIAEEQGIDVSSEVADYLERERADFDTDAEYEEMLDSMFMNEDEYRYYIESAFLDGLLEATMSSGSDDAGTTEPSEERVLENARTLASTYDGARKSTAIAFSLDDEETAQDVADQIQQGEITFDEALERYGDQDTQLASGDMGWDVLNIPSDAYSTALGELVEGQVSELVVDDEGAYIILCTDVFTAPAQLASVTDLPEEFQQAARTISGSQTSLDGYQQWFEEQRAAADITIADMPSGLPYDVG